MRRSSFRDRRRWSSPVFVALVVLVAGLTAWGTGFALFARQAAALPAEPDRVTDAIVVLTGGSLRLTTGLSLLEAEQAEKLFVSGVYRGVDVEELLRISRQAPEAVECCVVLGYAAGDTRGNASESAAWLEAQGYTSFRLVTANYHMPRSLLEFRRALPEIEIVAHPVAPANVHVDRWWRWPGTTALLISEYNKYLVALLRGMFE